MLVLRCVQFIGGSPSVNHKLDKDVWFPWTCSSESSTRGTLFRSLTSRSLTSVVTNSPDCERRRDLAIVRSEDRRKKTSFDVKLAPTWETKNGTQIEIYTSLMSEGQKSGFDTFSVGFYKHCVKRELV